jgi:hypothetical protein
VIWNKLERQRVPNSSLAPSLANVRSFPDPLSAAEATDDQLPPATEPEPEVALPPEPAVPPSPPPAAVAGPILSAAEARRLMPSHRLEAVLRTIEGLIRESAERDADHLTVSPEVLDLAPEGPLMGKIVERLRAAGYSVREPRLGESGLLQVLWSDEADAG